MWKAASKSIIHAWYFLYKKFRFTCKCKPAVLRVLLKQFRVKKLKFHWLQNYDQNFFHHFLSKALLLKEIFIYRHFIQKNASWNLWYISWSSNFLSVLINIKCFVSMQDIKVIRWVWQTLWFIFSYPSRQVNIWKILNNF